MFRESKPSPSCNRPIDASTERSSKEPLCTGLMCVCSCKGTVCLVHPLKGEVIGSMRLPGEVFSSPAIVNDRIVVGCRDESVYCLCIEEFTNL